MQLLLLLQVLEISTCLNMILITLIKIPYQELHIKLVLQIELPITILLVTLCMFYNASDVLIIMFYQLTMTTAIQILFYKIVKQPLIITIVKFVIQTLLELEFQVIQILMYLLLNV